MGEEEEEEKKNQDEEEPNKEGEEWLQLKFTWYA